jgi:hypothetical protein
MQRFLCTSQWGFRSKIEDEPQCPGCLHDNFLNGIGQPRNKCTNDVLPLKQPSCGRVILDEIRNGGTRPDTFLLILTRQLYTMHIHQVFG